MRTIHRWISICGAIFLLVVGTTGVVLQVQKLLGGESEEREREAGADKVIGGLTTSTANSEYAVLLSRTLEAARVRAPGQPVASVELRLGGEEPQGVVTLPGEPGRQITVDARDGKITKDEKHEAESLILRIHSGEILGEPGVVLGVLWGLALVALSVTGLVVYLDMYTRRRKARGKTGIFW